MSTQSEPEFNAEASTALDVIEPSMQFSACDVPDTFTEQVQLSDRLARAGAILPAHLRGKPESVHAEMIAARSLNLPMWTAFQHLFVVDGRVEMSARLMGALVRRAGHRIEPVEETSGHITLRLVRCDDDVSTYTATYSVADARRAELDGKTNWMRYPTDMLFSRCVSRLTRRWCSEVTMGAYLIGEVPAETDDGTEFAAIEARELLEKVLLAPTRAEVVALGRQARREGLCPIWLDGATLEDRINDHLASMPRQDVTVIDAEPADTGDGEPAETDAEAVADCGCTVTDALMHGRQCPAQMTAAFGPGWDDDVTANGQGQ